MTWSCVWSSMLEVAQDYFKEILTRVSEKNCMRRVRRTRTGYVSFGFIMDSVMNNHCGDEVWKVEYESERYDKYRDKIDEYGMPSSDWYWSGGGYW